MSLRQEVYQYFAHRTMAVVVISGAFVASTALVVRGWKATSGHEIPEAATARTLEATGTASAPLHPDHVTWKVTIHGHGDDKDSAIAAVRSSASDARDWLLAHGIATSELAAEGASATTDESTVTRHNADGTEYQEDTAPGWEATQVITVASAEIPHVLAAAKTAALDEAFLGAEVEEPSCTQTGADKLETSLVTAARQNARAKLEAALKDLDGGRIGKMVTANIGAFEAGTACTDATATATASVTYEIE